MAARWFIWVVLGALALSAMSARAQLGPPMGVAHAHTNASPQAHGDGQAELAERPVRRPAEADMPLMAPPERDGALPVSPASGVGGWMRSLASVALVVGLILVLAAVGRFVSRRSGSVAAMMGPGGRAPSGVLEVLARYPVGRGQVLVLLRIDRRVLLLSQNMAGKSGGFSTLAQFDEPSEVAAILRQTRDDASESVSARFRQAMERFQGTGDGMERGEIIEVGPRGEPLPKGRGVWA